MARGRVATARVVTDHASTARVVMARRATGVVDRGPGGPGGPGAKGPGTTVRGATGRGATVPIPTAPDRTSHARRDRAGPRIGGAPPVLAPTAAGRAGPVPRVGGARVRDRIAVAPGRTVAIRGPDRAIDSDRVRGRDRGRIVAPMSAVTNPATNRGDPMIGHPDLAEASASDPARDHGTPVAQATGRAPVARPGGARSPVGPTAAAPTATDRIDRGRAPIAHIRTRKATSAAAARLGRAPCHRQTRSVPTRSLSPADDR